MRTVFCTLALTLTITATGCFANININSITGAEISTPPKISYVARLLSCTNLWKAQIPKIEQSAAKAAMRVTAGGNLYVAGPQQSFWREARGRSGGLMLVKHYNPQKQKLTNKDTMLLAIANYDNSAKLITLLKNISKSGTHVAIFAGNKNISSSINIPNLDVTIFANTHNLGVLQQRTVSNIIGMWTWTAGFITACVNLGKMPVVYESYGMPGARERAKFYKTRNSARFHKHTNITKQDVKNLDKRYLNKLQHALQMVSKTQFQALQRSATLLIKAHQQGKTCLVYYLGHMFPEQIQLPTNITWLKPEARTTKPDKLPKNSAVLALGYESFPWELADRALQAGAPCIITSSGKAPTEFTRQKNCIYINPYWNFHDAAVTIKNYDIPILPISGIMQAAVYWDIVGLINNYES